MNQNLKIVLIAAAIFLASMSVWMLILGRNDVKDTHVEFLEKQAENVQSNLILPTDDLHKTEGQVGSEGG